MTKCESFETRLLLPSKYKTYSPIPTFLRHVNLDLLAYNTPTADDLHFGLKFSWSSEKVFRSSFSSASSSLTFSFPILLNDARSLKTSTKREFPNNPNLLLLLLLSYLHFFQRSRLNRTNRCKRYSLDKKGWRKTCND